MTARIRAGSRQHYSPRRRQYPGRRLVGRLRKKCGGQHADAIDSVQPRRDNNKQVEGVLKSHNESVVKADEIRAKAVEKSAREAVLQLTRLASKAFSEKDRVSETNAWKAILTVDRSNPKATQYFKDLGTLEKTLGELASSDRYSDAIDERELKVVDR